MKSRPISASKMRRYHIAPLKRTLQHFVFVYCLLNVPSEQFSLRDCVLRYITNTDNLNISCSHMKLTKIPSPLPIHSSLLDISHNSISEVKAKDFHNLSTLTDLDLSKNDISSIKNGTFKDLFYLERLHLHYNKLKIVTRGWLEGLSSISALRLDRNQIEAIEQSAFVSLSNLTFVNLAGNHLKHLEQIEALLNLPNLLKLFIAENRFQSFISHNLSATPLKLEKLDLSINQLRIFQITNNILPNLNNLDLTRCNLRGHFQWSIQNHSFLNSIDTLSLGGPHMSEEEIVKITQSFNFPLKMLQINNMKKHDFRRFLKNICNHVQKDLYLKYIKLSSLTDHLFKPCHHLRKLHLGHNNISNISPLSFEGLNQLEVLRIPDNALPELNTFTNVLPKLKTLDMSYNWIYNLHSFNTSNLTTLFLYHNYISEIKPCTFQNLANLEELHLGSNKLLRIEGIFQNLTHLKKLHLNENKLSHLSQGAFKGLCSLTDLILYDNQISRIAKNAFRGLDRLKNLELGSNKISQKTFEIQGLFLGMPHLEVLNLASNGISFDRQQLKSPPFKTLNSLKKLYINSQNIQFLPSNLLQGLNSLTHFYAGNINLQSLHSHTFIHTPNLKFLDLSKNRLMYENSLSPNIFHPIYGLSELYLSQNQLPSLDFLLKANLSLLTVLKATSNMLQIINQTLVQSLPQLTYLDLQNNPFICDCSNAWFLNWAINDTTTQVISLNKYKCSYPSSLKNQHLENLNTDSCNMDYEFIYFLCSSSLVIATMLISSIYNFLRWQLVYAFYLFLAFLYDSKQRQRQHQQGFQYDGFISYNSQDELWVLRELLPNLEEKQGWRLCLHHRDFEPGKSIIDNIVDSIYSSRKTICLITRNYLRSEWCSREIQVASFRLFDEKNDVLILVFLEDIPTHQLSPYHRMRKLIKKRTYLTWPKPGEDTSVFWQKLQIAMTTKKDENPILLGQDN